MQRITQDFPAGVLQVLDAMTDAPPGCATADTIVAMNQLDRALYPVVTNPRRPANTTRFVYLNPHAVEHWTPADALPGQ